MAIKIALRTLKENKLKIFRKIEKINLKIIKLKSYLQFNLTSENIYILFVL